MTIRITRPPITPPVVTGVDAGEEIDVGVFWVDAPWTFGKEVGVGVVVDIGFIVGLRVGTGVTITFTVGFGVEITEDFVWTGATYTGREHSG